MSGDWGPKMWTRLHEMAEKFVVPSVKVDQKLPGCSTCDLKAASYSEMDHVLHGTPRCDHCNAFGEMKECACNVAEYCNETCQLADWPNHKEECKKIRRKHDEKELRKSLEES